uniref:Uncharacterized protein n=1 Tax=Anopheles maculatus TaxID=74869 RepID=A0A182SJ15_9DIPT
MNHFRSCHYLAAVATEPSTGRRGKLSSLRRSLNALRCRISKRGRSKPPDQFLDKFSAASATSDTRLHQAGCVAPQAVPSDGVCSRLSVDPSLPSHYRVSSAARRKGFSPRLSPAKLRVLLSVKFTIVRRALIVSLIFIFPLPSTPP